MEALYYLINYMLLMRIYCFEFFKPEAVIEFSWQVYDVSKGFKIRKLKFRTKVNLAKFTQMVMVKPNSNLVKSRVHHVSMDLPPMTLQAH